MENICILADKQSNRMRHKNTNEYVYIGNTKSDNYVKTGIENCNVANNGKEVENVDNPNDIFKLRHSVCRTPPQAENDVEKQKMEENPGKRNRSIETPEADMYIKRPCDRTTPVQLDQNQSYIAKSPGAENKLDLEKTISDAFSSLDIISDITEKCSNGNEEQKTLNKATINIHKSLTRLIYKIGVLEKENNSLKFQIETKTNTNETFATKEHRTTDTNIERASIGQTEKSYAEISALKRNHPVPQNKEEKSSWTTPIHRKKFESKISITNINDAAITMQQVKQNLSTKNIGGGFKSIKYLKSGAIIVESHTEEQLDKVKLALTRSENIKITDTNNIDPMFMLTGLRKGLTNSELLEDLVNLNEEVRTELGISVTEKIKIIAKRPCRNQFKENWILQAPPDVAKWFLKREKIYIDLMVVYVQEHINLAVCFKCSGFGHIAKYCREKICCHKCGEEHQGLSCVSDILKCPNCTKLKLKPEESQHSARDPKCPVYRRRLGQYQSNIKYNSAQAEDFLPKVTKEHTH